MEKRNPWLEKSTKNLLAHSRSDNFFDAQREWSFTGDVIDYEYPSEICELCEHEELRYHFEIKNEHNYKSLWVGSSCILRFEEIYIYDEDGNAITGDEERKKQLEKVRREKQVNLMLEPLRILWKNYKNYRNDTVRNVNFFKRKGGFLPESLAEIFSILNRLKIDYKPEMFPIYLRSDYSKEQLENMPASKIELIKKSLSPMQYVKYSKLFKNQT